MMNLKEERGMRAKEETKEKMKYDFNKKKD